MTAQNPELQVSENTIATKVEAGHTADSGSNGEQSLSDNLQEKKDGIALEHEGDEPQYMTGFRLSAVMCTLFLTTLLAALDIVSIQSSALGNYFLTGS